MDFFFQQSKHFVSFLRRTSDSLVPQKFSSGSFAIFIQIVSQISLCCVLKQRDDISFSPDYLLM